MKQIFIICQSKGGSGKSFLTTLIAHKYEHDETVSFIDMDSSTRTLANQIAFINEKRIKKTDILNGSNKIERNSFIEFFEIFSRVKSEKVFIDMGATESEQLYQFLKSDMTPPEIKEYFDEISCELFFIIPVAGNTATVATCAYAKDMNELLGGNFNVSIMENMELTDSSSSEDITRILGESTHVEQFGYTESQTTNGSRVVNMIKGGQSASTLATLTKSKMRRLLEPIIF